MAIGLEQTGDILQRSQALIGQAVGRGTDLLADRVEHYTNLGREIGDMSRERGEPGAADFVQTLSQRGNQVARYLRTSDGARIWSDAQDFARGRTWLLTGAGFLGGLALARTLRSSQNGSDWDSEPDYVDSYAQPLSDSAGNYRR